MEDIKKICPKFQENGCLVTIYPPTYETDLKKLEDNLALKGMYFHQIIFLFSF
jgi:hypothetical protein